MLTLVSTKKTNLKSVWNLEYEQLSMEDQLKFKIAASFLIQLQNREAKTLLDIMERRNELDL